MNNKSSENNSETISVVIRARNVANELNRCLTKLKNQVVPKGKKLEVIVVDNDSDDETVQVARHHDAIIVEICRKDFSWGRALNRGITKAAGDIILILSADAEPADENFVCEMTRPFTDADMAVVFGRQLPSEDAPVDERVRLEKMFRPTPEFFDRLKHSRNLTGRDMTASNACAAIRKSLWQKNRYDENTSGGEEGPFICYALKCGLSVIYQPSAKVYHSHRDRIFRLACRELEILNKNLAYRGRLLLAGDKIRLLAGFMKRRLRNCVQPRMPLKIRLEGLFRLPLELAAIAIVGFCSNNRLLKKYRYIFWG